jgi:hypothetical protein
VCIGVNSWLKNFAAKEIRLLGIQWVKKLVSLSKEIKMKAPAKLFNKEIPQDTRPCGVDLRPAGSSGVPPRVHQKSKFQNETVPICEHKR